MNIYIKKGSSSNLESINIEDKELGKGGQARVHKVTTRSHEQYCVKIFINPEDAIKNQARINYMIANPPSEIMGDNSNFRICWPIASAYNTNKEFIGYMMPLAFPESRDLKILEVYNPKPIALQAKYKKYPAWHNKYELNDITGLSNRIKMLFNWALAIHHIHASQHYVIIDLKPENVMATGTGKISVVDTDSFQIYKDNNLLYPGPAYTPTYFPPEGKLYKEKNQPFPVSCDLFAAAVVFYKILTGVHPYGGTKLKPPYDTLETEEECIKEGLFAYGEKSNYLEFASGFNLHANFNNLPIDVKKLFIRAFGSNINDRPQMAEWGQTFRKAIHEGSIQIRSVSKPVNLNSPSIKITSASFGNTDENSNTIQQPGATLHVNDVAYLTPHINYQVMKAGSSVDIWYKIYNPSGQLLANNGERPGFTWKGTVDCYSTSGSTALGGWGNSQKTCYSTIGSWRVEFYERDICLFKSSFDVVSKTTPPPVKQPVTPPKKTTKPPRPPKKNKFAKVLLTLALLVAAGYMGYQYWYKPMLVDKDALRTYVYVPSLILRSDKDAGAEHNKVRSLPYGSEIITYSKDDDGWSTVKASGDNGYVSTAFTLDKEDFDLLNNVWGDKESPEGVPTGKCRLALLDFLKRNELTSGPDGWQLFAQNIDATPNTVLYPNLNNEYNKFTEFAFIISNKKTNEWVIAMYSFKDDETPVLVYANTAPESAKIKSITYNSGSNRYSVNYI